MGEAVLKNVHPTVTGKCATSTLQYAHMVVKLDSTHHTVINRVLDIVETTFVMKQPAYVIMVAKLVIILRDMILHVRGTVSNTCVNRMMGSVC